MPAIRVATEEDVEYLAPRLREADKAELAAGFGLTSYQALMESYRASDPPYVGVDDDDVPVLMFGVAPIAPKLGSVWMLSTDDIYKHIRVFLRQSRATLDGFNKRWPVLFNYCDERNVAHILWMKKLGYTFIARHPTFGVARTPFLEFVRVKCVSQP